MPGSGWGVPSLQGWVGTAQLVAELIQFSQHALWTACHVSGGVSLLVWAS